MDAVRYRYTSKDEGDLPFTVNVFNSKKGGKTNVQIEVEWNHSSNLAYQEFESLQLVIPLGGEVELLKGD